MAARPGTPKDIFVSGFCLNGACDDKRAQLAVSQRCKYEYKNGKKQPTKKVGNKVVNDGEPRTQYIRCACSCHRVYAVMYGEVTKDTNKSFDPCMEHPDERPLISRHKVSAAVASVVRNDPRPVPVTPDRPAVALHATPTGRRNRGGLEGQVRAVCDRYVTGSLTPDEPMTPKFISKQIGPSEKTGNPPSSGAINAVFDRWERDNFAVIGRKPTRFISYMQTADSVAARDSGSDLD